MVFRDKACFNKAGGQAARQPYLELGASPVKKGIFYATAALSG